MSKRQTVCTISLTLAKPGEAMPGPYSSWCFAGVRPGAVPDGGPGEENGGQRRHRSDSTFNFKQRQSHAPQRGACDCQERIRQLVEVVWFTPGPGIVSSTTWATIQGDE